MRQGLAHSLRLRSTVLCPTVRPPSGPFVPRRRRLLFYLQLLHPGIRHPSPQPDPPPTTHIAPAPYPRPHQLLLLHRRLETFSPGNKSPTLKGLTPICWPGKPTSGTVSRASICETTVLTGDMMNHTGLILLRVFFIRCPPLCCNRLHDPPPMVPQANHRVLCSEHRLRSSCNSLHRPMPRSKLLHRKPLLSRSPFPFRLRLLQKPRHRLPSMQKHPLPNIYLLRTSTPSMIHRLTAEMFHHPFFSTVTHLTHTTSLQTPSSCMVSQGRWSTTSHSLCSGLRLIVERLKQSVRTKHLRKDIDNARYVVVQVVID